MLIGIPGSGKSSWLKQLPWVRLYKNHGIRFEIICPDQIRKELSGGIYDQSLNVPAWREAKKRAVEALQAGRSVILDATNVETSRRREFVVDLPACVKMAKVFEVMPEKAWLRIKADLDVGRDRSPISEETIYMYYGRFLYTKKVLVSEGFRKWVDL